MIKFKDEKFFSRAQAISGFSSTEKNSLDLLYWRKCNNIRREILFFINENDIPMYEDGYITYLTPEQTIALCHRLMTFYNKKWWRDNSDSIWDYNEISFKKWKEELKLVITFMRYVEKYLNSSDYEIYFYDSY